MSKMLTASCVGGVVTCEGVVIPSAVVGSEGVGSSTGALFLDEDTARYIANTTPDLKTTLDDIVLILTQLKIALDQTVTALNTTAATFTATFATMTGPTTVPPPTGPAGVVSIGVSSALITAAATQIDLLKAQLNTLKGVLK